MVQKFPGKVSRNSGNCWISEMAETLNRKTPGAKLNGKKTSGKKCISYSKPIPRLVSASRGCSLFWKFWKMLLHSLLEVAENSNQTFWLNGKRKFVFHFFQAISQAFAAVFGKWDSFGQISQSGRNLPVLHFAYHLPKPWTDRFLKGFVTRFGEKCVTKPKDLRGTLRGTQRQIFI